MNLGLANCAAIVGGASSGLGRATALALAAEGCDVTLFARRENMLTEVAAEISAMQGAGQAVVVAGDSSSARDLRRATTTTFERFGRIDVLINNTGGPPVGGFSSVSDEDWLTSFESLVLSAMRLTRLALPHLRSSGRGRIINISSVVVKEIDDRLMLSNALRPALTGWAKHLSRSEGCHGITVNSVAPGYIDTARAQYVYSSDSSPTAARAADERRVPLRRLGEPSELGATVAFLASAQASYISGVTLLVDGGLSRGLLS